MAFRVLADVLRMAKTEEQKDRIKWFHARRVFFELRRCADGLALAALCRHEDARFLVSLFPRGAPATKKETADVLLSHSQDPRCLCWAADCDAPDYLELLKRSAQGGYAWGQAVYSLYLPDKEAHVWLEKAAAAHDAEAFMLLGDNLLLGRGMDVDRMRAGELLRKASELGCPVAQCRLAESFFARDDSEYYEWIRRSALQSNVRALSRLCVDAVGYVKRLREAGGSGRIVFEIGGALAGIHDWKKEAYGNPVHIEACESAIRLYEHWSGEARRAVLCWLWLAKDAGVAKDIRLLIADLIWQGRCVWSERGDMFVT